jgi:glycosyltransferase involved in cell wall biosynthesis
MTNSEMTFLINASNLKAGGGLQVADSICSQLEKFPQHRFIVVQSKHLDVTAERIKDYCNVDVYRYDIPTNLRSVVFGRDPFLDGIVKNKNVQAVLTVFGPSRWKPLVPHLSGFALSQLVIPESPYFQRMSKVEHVKWWLWCLIRKWSLKRSADAFWTENPYISDRLETLMGRPRVHLCGFARAQLLLRVPNDNYNLNFSRIKEKLTYAIWAFRRSSKVFYTENEYISEILRKRNSDMKVFTVSNYYNQVYDQPEKWKRSINLPEFDGVTCLSVSSPSSHKNFGIIEGIVRYLREVHPDFKVRFVLTFSEQNWPMAEDVRDCIVYIGKTDVSECPNLYEQADIMFMPTLLECFTATYPEAMRMEVPIVTTDLEFARGLCGEAACYYSAVDAKAAAEAIYKVATDKDYAKQLTEAGKKQLQTYDNYEQRADKLVRILESMVE